MKTIHFALIAMRVCLLTLWSGAAVAAAVTLPAAQAAQVVDVWQLAWCCVCSTLAGVSALFIRINAMLLRQDAGGGKFVRPWLFTAMHMTGSWAAGCGMYLLGGAFHWEGQYQLFSVLMASFAGARFMELGAEKVIGNISLEGGGTTQ